MRFTNFIAPMVLLAAVQAQEPVETPDPGLAAEDLSTSTTTITSTTTLTSTITVSQNGTATDGPTAGAPKPTDGDDSEVPIKDNLAAYQQASLGLLSGAMGVAVLLLI